MKSEIQVVLGDITTLSVDALVNAANQALQGGGGVDGAIHRAAGPELMEACRLLGGCETGKAKITPGYRLEAKWVIHTVGPVWNGGTRNEEPLLRSCYRESIILARKHTIRSIAFPSISTGAYHFPIEIASRVAVEEVMTNLAEADGMRVLFCCFSKADRAFYEKVVHSSLSWGTISEKSH